MLFLALLVSACSSADLNQGESNPATKDISPKQLISSATKSKKQTGPSNPNFITEEPTSTHTDTPDPQETTNEPEVSEDQPSDTAEDPALRLLIDDCGIANVLKKEANEEIYKSELKSLAMNSPDTERPAFSANSVMDFNTTASKSNTSMNFKVNITAVLKNGSPFNHPDAWAIARRKADEKSGFVKFENYVFENISTLGDKHDIWNNIFCTVQPGIKVSGKRGGYSTDASFDPPLPYTLSPRANSKRFALEIGESRVFSNITATIISTDHPLLKNVKQISGSVTISKVQPTLNSHGKAISGDVAYQVKTEFKDENTTNALGLVPEMTFYINTEKRDYNAFVLNSKQAPDPPAVLVLP